MTTASSDQGGATARGPETYCTSGQRPFVPCLVKLRPPVLGEDIVARPRMLDLLEASRDNRVLVVSAPAGYGKTTFLAQWAAQDPRSSVWLQIDEHHNDKVELLSYLVHSLRRVAAVDPRVDEWLITQHPPIDSLILPALANDLCRAEPFLFVLDDIDTLAGDEAWALLEFVVEYAPPGAQVALGGRVEPRMSLGRLQADRQLGRVRAEDLSFRQSEAGALMAVGGLHLEDDALNALLSQTEGWATGLQLARLHLQHNQNAVALSKFRGDVGHLPLYFTQEVLAGLPSAVQHFMLRTSVLRRLNAGLCNAVTGCHDSGEMLAELERSNVFVTRLDRSGRWYRYHPLFAEWLRTQLERLFPDEARVLHRRAASWYGSRDQPDNAFDHWLAAGEEERASEVVVRHYRAWALSGRGQTVLKWFDAFDEEQIQRYPQLALAGAWAAALQGHSQTAAVRLAAAERGDVKAPSLDGAASFGSALTLFRAMMGWRGVGSLLKDAETSYELEHSVGGTHEAAAALLVGAGRLLSERDIPGARVFLEQGAAIGRHGRPGARAGAVGLLALIAGQSGGDWGEAYKLATVARRVVEDNKISDLRYVACVYAVLGLVKSRRGEAESAREDLALVDGLLPGLASVPWLAAMVYVMMASSELALGHVQRAQALQHQAARAAARLPDAGLLAEWIEDLRAKVTAPSSECPALTPSELRVLQKLASFQQLSSIANDLFLSRNTVKFHVKLIYRKLGVNSRTDAIERARSLGMVEVN